MPKSISLQIDTTKCVSSLSPFLFGHFIENMYDCIDPGLHAQLLTSRGFEYPDSNEDGVSDPWFPVGHGEYSIDRTRSISPSNSQRIKCGLKNGFCGISQNGLALHELETYIGSFWIYAETNALVEVQVLTEDNAAVYAGTFSTDINKWTKQAFHFTSLKEQCARILFLVHGTAEIWLDQVSLSPQNAPCKVWPNVLSYIKNLNPTILRFPGGCFADCYHWMDGIGNPDLRPARPNLHWGGTEENGFGTDEFLALCLEIGAEPMICVNFGSGTPEEAAAWVEYCNGPADSRYGALRAANGHAAPYGVKYWDIGNEAFAEWEIGHCDADAYCEKFQQFATAMRQIDSGIKLIACGGDGNSSDQSWNETLCKQLGNTADYLGIHNYTPLTGKKFADPKLQYYGVAAAPVQYELRMRETQQVLQSYPGQMMLAVTEWNCNYQDGTEQEQTMEAAICNAGMLNAFIRMGSAVQISMISDLINGWPGGIIRSRNGYCYGTPSYYVLTMYAQARPTSLLSCQYDSPDYAATEVGNLKAFPHIPYLDIAACKTEDERICVFIVNRNLDSAYTIELPEDLVATSIYTLTAENFHAKNTQDRETITPHNTVGSFKCIEVLPCSVNKVYIA